MAINNSFYDSLGDRWYTAFDDPVALLRMESLLKNPWVKENIISHFGEAKDLKVLDVGCGAGFVSNYLAKEKYEVYGIDASHSSLEVAKRYDTTSTATYTQANAYSLPYPGEYFQVITAMDFLEHVVKPELVIQEISRVLKPGGIFFFQTINRNTLSYLLAIKMLHWLVRNTPHDMHDWKLFLKPQEVAKFCFNHSMDVRKTIGMRPSFSKITLGSLKTGIVPKDFEFKFTRSLALSYMGYAQKRI